MLKGNLSREQVIEILGIELVEKLEKENCYPTNRAMNSGMMEFAAAVKIPENENLHNTLIAYYYQDQEDVDAVEEYDLLDWEIEGYEII